MTKIFVRAILLLFMILAAIALLVVQSRNGELEHERAALILKYDSLHIQHLEMKAKLELTERRLDSFLLIGHR